MYKRGSHALLYICTPVILNVVKDLRRSFGGPQDD